MAKPQVHIFFGSQTGTAECFSEELRDEAEGLGIIAEVVDLEKFTPESFLACPLTILVVSTYGDGEPTDNAVKFHKWASDPRNDGVMAGRRFCVMGLGDMNYSRFNNMGAMTDQNLERLGGARIFKRGVGDDSQDIADDFKQWREGGLWPALKQAIEEVLAEGGYTARAVSGGEAVDVAPVVFSKKVEVYVFYAHDNEADGAAKDVCEEAVGKLKELGAAVPLTQTLSDRKAVEAVRKLPKRSLALVIADAGPDGLCGAGRKLIRNMQIELDTNFLADKEPQFAVLTVASSKCNNSAASLRSQIAKATEGVGKGFERLGAKPCTSKIEGYIDAGVDNVSSFLAQYCAELYDSVSKSAAPAAAANGVAGTPAAAAAGAAAAPAGPAAPAILCTGGEAREAGDALAGVWPQGKPVLDDATLQTLLAVAQKRSPVVIAVDCAADGSLGDSSRGLAAQLGAVPIALRAQLKQLRFALVAVAATDYGNAGERASANAMRAELTRAAAPVAQSLTKYGASCVCEVALDLQDADEAALVAQCQALSAAFSSGGKNGAAQAAPAAVPAAGFAPAARPAEAGALTLHMAPADGTLPAEVPGEAADILAKFYFEAETTRITKVRELRQQPDPSAGLSTVEVELEAVADGLKGYSAGGTLSLLPQNDPADISAMLPLLGLSPADLMKKITFTAGNDPATPIKRPFPTPCTVGEALAKYCDLARAPTKKMLNAMQDRVEGVGASERLGKLLADTEALELLRNSPACCRMHEFWALLGVTGMTFRDFLLFCPRQKPREFTIASSSKATPDRITLCVSLTSHDVADPGAVLERLGAAEALAEGARLPDERGRFFGMCSRWLTTRLRQGDMVLAKQRPSPLKVPERDVPIIMVGSGAGVAPFRGFWEELRRGPQSSPAALFFGCRHPEKDWLFKDEMSACVKLAATGCAALQRVQVGPKRPLTCLFTAFSRPDGKEGQYVQDHLRAQSRSVKHWVDNMDGMVFICGSTAMGNGVLEVLGEVLEGGKEKVEELRKSGRIVAEMWG